MYIAQISIKIFKCVFKSPKVVSNVYFDKYEL